MIKLPRLFEEGVFTKLIHPLSLSITENIIPLSTATIKLLQEEALPPRSYIELFTPYGSAGMFRVRNPRDAYGDDTTSAELEHMISEVGDYVVKEEISEMVPAANAIARLFHYYDGQLWALGDIEQIGFEEVAVEIDHESVLEGILDVMRQCPDCFLQFDFSQEPWKINVARKSSTFVAEGRLSRNVSSAIVSYDDTELITRLWYKDYTNSDEGEWTFIDSETIEDYGVKEGKVSTSADMTDAEKWRTIETYLYEHRHPNVMITIQAAELSRLTGERIDQFRIGDRMRLALPDYNFTESEIISMVQWSDVINSPNSVELTLGNDEDTVVKYIHDSTSSSGGGGGGGSKTLDRLYYEFWSDDGYFHSRLEMTYQHLETEFWEGYNYLYSRVEQTARYWQAEFVNMYDGLRGFVELTAEHWQSEFTNTYAGLSSRIEQTASYWQAEFTNMYSGLRGFVELTAEHWQSEFTNTYAGLSSRIEQTAQHWQSELSDTYAGLSSRIEQTAGYWSSEIANVYSGLSSRVLQTENSWSATVTAIGADGQITAATIATAINDGKSGAWIDAENVWIGNDKSTTVIAGKLEATDITADLIKAKIALITNVAMNAVAVTGALVCSGSVSGSQLGGQTIMCNGYDISNPIMSASVSNNTLTLTKADGTTTTFSKATTLTGDWSGSYQAGKKYVVTASPQNVTKESPTVNSIAKYGNPTWASDEHSFDQQILVSDSDGNAIYLGSINVTGITKGTFSAVQVTPISSTTAIRIDSTAVTLYNAGTSSVTARGDSVTARETVSSGGTIYYQAGTAATYYNAGTSTVVGRGDSVTAREVFAVTSSSGTSYYQALAGEDYYQGDGGSYTVQGSAFARLYRWGNGSLYSPTAGGGWHPEGSHTWYYVDNSNGTQTYYGGSETVVGRGTKVTINAINTSTKIRIGTATTYYKGNGGTKTIQGSSVSVTPISSTTAIRLGSAGTYYKGNGGSYTVQGTAQAAYKKLTSGGTIYYQAASAKTYYNKS